MTAPAREVPGAAIFRPRSIALVGASDDPKKTTARPLAFLRRSGWSGSLYPVNPTRSTVLGERAWPTLAELPEVPEHVFVLTGSDAAVEAVAECARLGVPVVSVLADGFIGTGEKAAARRAALLAAVGTAPTRVLGPSTLGVVNVHESMPLTANAVFAGLELRPGGIFVASQSGSAIGALATRGAAMGLGFAGMVSTGAALDLSLGELCMATVDDDRVTGYALFLESLDGAEDLRRFALAAAERGKPVLAYKLGRSNEAAELSVSHTGALAGDDDIATAFLTDLGIGRVTMFETLLEGMALAGAVPLPQRPVRRPRVAVVTTTGGGGSMAVDCLAVRGADVSPPAPQTAARLRELGVDPGHGALLDLTLAGTRYEVMKGALDVLTNAPEYDVVVAVPGSSARFQPELVVKPIADSAGQGAPLAAFVVPEAPAALELLRGAGVAAFRTPESCADAVLAAFARQQPRAAAATAVPVGVASRTLDEVESYRLLGELGVPHAPYAVLTVGEPIEELPVAGPVAVKALTSELAHKSDAGGVVLNVGTVEELRAAVARIVERVAAHVPGLTVERVLVQSMVRGVGEVLVGLTRDRDAGPVVLLAAGGVLAEILADRSIRPAPVDLATAREMVAEVRALRALAGYRGAVPGDLDALAEAVVALSAAAARPGPVVLEAEVNPLLVLPRGQGVVAVDALVRQAVEGR